MTRQSDSRVPGRGGEPKVPARPGGGPPASFGRAVPEDPIEVPAAERPSPVRAQDGKVVLEVGADLVLSEESSQRFYDQVRSLVELAVADGFAAGLAQQDGDPGGDDEAAAAGEKP